MKALIRRRVLWRLIWVCTVCLCPENGMLGLYGLNGGSYETFLLILDFAIPKLSHRLILSSLWCRMSIMTVCLSDLVPCRLVLVGYWSSLVVLTVRWYHGTDDNVFALKIKKTTCEPRHDKTNKVTGRPAKTLIRLGRCPV